MGHLKRTLRAVTPLLIHGAQSDGPAELRPPSFRGEWRYWFRAAAGAVIGDRNRDGLVKMESAVFGSTDKGSAVTLKITQSQVKTAPAKVLPHKQDGGSRSAISGGEEFEIEISSKPTALPEVWEAAKTSFVLMVTLGGVGQRARRGYGTLQVKDSEAARITSLKGWETYLDDRITKTLEAVRQLAQKLNVTVQPTVNPSAAAFPCGNRESRIRLVEPQFPSAMDAVVGFMRSVPKQGWLGGINPRQASPLWVRPIQVGSKYGLILTVLASNFPGSNYLEMDRFLAKYPGKDVGVKGWNL